MFKRFTMEDQTLSNWPQPNRVVLFRLQSFRVIKLATIQQTFLQIVILDFTLIGCFKVASRFQLAQACVTRLLV